MSDDLELTLKVSEDARAALAKTLERALTELEKARADAQALKQSYEKPKREFDAERAKLLEEAAKAMEAAEQVRREGIEALEEARDLRKKLG